MQRAKHAEYERRAPQHLTTETVPYHVPDPKHRHGPPGDSLRALAAPRIPRKIGDRSHVGVRRKIVQQDEFGVSLRRENAAREQQGITRSLCDTQTQTAAQTTAARLLQERNTYLQQNPTSGNDARQITINTNVAAGMQPAAATAAHQPPQCGLQ